MLQTSAWLGWILAVSTEGFVAFGAPFPLGKGLVLGAWIWVLLVHGFRLLSRKPEEGRPLLFASAVTLLVYLLGFRFEELWLNVPMEYLRSRRAEFLSTELRGIPWLLLLVIVGFAPGALLLARWVAAGGGPAALSSRADWFKRGGALLGLAYLGLTLLVTVRYGSGGLAP